LPCTRRTRNDDITASTESTGKPKSAWSPVGSRYMYSNPICSLTFQFQKCYLKGTCKQGHLTHVDKVADLATCMNKCKEDSQCNFVSFNQDFKTCQLYTTCPSTDAAACPSCITSAETCDSTIPCNVHGQCQVSTIVT